MTFTTDAPLKTRAICRRLKTCARRTPYDQHFHRKDAVGLVWTGHRLTVISQIRIPKTREVSQMDAYWAIVESGVKIGFGAGLLVTLIGYAACMIRRAIRAAT